MKKKLITTTVLILLLAVSLSLLVGCDEMFTRNDERDMTQVVATVTYKEQTANVYKFELKASFSSYSYAYVNYYGMSYEEAADYILQSLAQQKLLALYAREKVSQLLGLTAIPEDVTKLLTRSEQDKAIDNANESLLSSLKSLVESNITEDNYNSGTTTSGDKPNNDKETEVTDPVYVRFESNGGSAVTRLRIQKNTKITKAPEDPTKEGYTFYGWYQNKELTGDEFDFESQINNSMTLYAKWVEYTAPRTEMPEAEEEEEDDYDPDLDTEDVEISPKFFTDEYYATLLDEFRDEDFVEKMVVPEGKEFDEVLKDYIDNGLATLKDNIEKNTFKKTDEERYAYYLGNQYDTILIEKMQRLIGETVEVSEDEVEAEFNRLVEKNKETFTGENAESSYSSALTSSLNNTYFHTSTEHSYGFVVNILLKLDADSLKVLTDMCKANPSNTEAIKIMRNRLISEMQIKVSNPSYDSKEKVNDAEGKEIELRDPMTDPKNPYNNVGKSGDYNHDYQVEGGNNYNQLISFKENENGEFEIVYGATEHPAMAYLLEKVPAFDKGDQIGVIHQIYNSFEQVKAFVTAGKLTKEQGVYWLREVATKWLYLVGDDSGAVTDSSNNKGLGYLITPEGQDSSYLEEFTDYARKLIDNGTGSYATGNVTDSMFVGANTPDGNIEGNGVAYVVADSFIETNPSNYDNAYAGVFVLLNSYTVWDKTALGDDVTEDGVLPLDFKMTFEKDDEDNKTIKEVIYDMLLEAKKTTAYNLDVNSMGVQYQDNIVYFNKAYKSLWKDAEK